MLDWTSEAKPVLVACCALSEDNEAFDVTSVRVADTLGRPHAAVARTMAYLSDAGYLVTENSIDQRSGEIMVEVERLTEKTLQELSGWPVPGLHGDAAAAFIAAIEEQMLDADPEERSRLAKLRDAASDVGRDVIARVLTELAARQV